jgi:hypothetical protein
LSPRLTEPATKIPPGLLIRGDLLTTLSAPALPAPADPSDPFLGLLLGDERAKGPVRAKFNGFIARTFLETVRLSLVSLVCVFCTLIVFEKYRFMVRLDAVMSSLLYGPAGRTDPGLGRPTCSRTHVGAYLPVAMVAFLVHRGQYCGVRGTPAGHSRGLLHEESRSLGVTGNQDSLRRPSTGAYKRGSHEESSPPRGPPGTGLLRNKSPREFPAGVLGYRTPPEQESPRVLCRTPKDSLFRTSPQDPVHEESCRGVLATPRPRDSPKSRDSSRTGLLMMPLHDSSRLRVPDESPGLPQSRLSTGFTI